MTVSPREAHPSKHRFSFAAVHSWLLLMLLSLFAASAFAQGLSPGGPVNFGDIDLQQTTSTFLTFTAPIGGTDITSIAVVTEGVTGKDFAVTPNSTCLGVLYSQQTCTIYLSFTPQQIGLRLGALSITDSAGTVVNLVYLYGVGVGPQFVFQPATATAIDTASVVGSFKPSAAVQDPDGDILFTDVPNNRILEESATTGAFSILYPVAPNVSTLALSDTSGLAIDGTGTLYVSSGASVYSLLPGATTLSPVATTGVTLKTPTGLAVDPRGDLYIADSGNNAVYEVPLGGGTAFDLPLPGLAAPASLSGPTGLAVDDNLTLYIADTGNNRIVEIPLTGSPNATAFKPTSITLSHPTGVAVDPAGTLYIADTGNHQIVEATAPGDQFVLSTLPQFTFGAPAAVLIEANGNLVVSDTSLGLVTLVRSTAIVNFPTPTVVGTLDTTTGEDPEILTVQGTGNIASSLNAGIDPAFSGTNPTAFLLASTGSTCPSLTTGEPVTSADTFSIGQVCTYDLNFRPTVVGPNLANLVLSTTAAGGLTSTNSAKLSGIGLSNVAYFQLVAIPSVINLGQSVELILTAYQSDGSVATDYSGTVTFTYADLTTGTRANGVYLGGTTYTMTAGVLTIPAATGLQLNAYGTFTATAAAESTYVQNGVIATVTSNNIYVVEPSTLTFTSSVNPSLVNQNTVFTLTITTTGGVPPGGSVSFYNGTTLIGTETVTTTSATTGIASITDSFPATGSYPIKAVYTSTSNTAGGTATLTQFVGYTTTATLTSSVNPVAVNANTTLTATIKSTTGTPTGIVTFKSNGAAIGTGTLSGGVATLVTSFRLPGVYTLVAVYAGDANNQGATTNTVLETVLNVANLSLISSVNPVFLDNPTILTATLTTAAAGTTPSGTISFFDGSTPIGSGTIVNGTVSVTASFVYAGSHNLTAVYSGDAADAPGTSPVYAQTVADFSIAVASGGSATGSTIAGGTVTYSLAVTPLITSTLPGPITLTFSGLPTSVTGTLTPATIATGSGATPVAFAATAAPLPGTARLQPPPAHHSRLGYAPITLALLALPLAWFRRRKRFASLLASICLLFAITAGLSGCVSAANTGYYGQTPQTYNLTVTASSGNLSRSTYLTLTVQ
jgi:sugar lactone lactonase YvrE